MNSLNNTRSLALEVPREMNEWLHSVLQPALPLVYSPWYLALAAGDYGDRAYVLACDYWRDGDRISASWCARVFKAHKALCEALESAPNNVCPYCTFFSETDQAMADHINREHSALEPRPVTAANWWEENWA